MGRSPQPPPPRRGRSPNRIERERSASRGGSEDHSDTSSYGSEVRAGQSPEIYYEPRVAIPTSGRGRPDVPPPPLFFEEVFMAGVQAGAAIQSAQHIHLTGDGGSIGRASFPREENQPQGAPEPELPGASDPSESEQTSREIGGESDGETLQLNPEDGSDYPDHTDTDPYEDPTSSQAEVEPSPDVEQIDIDDSPDESQAAQESEDTSEQVPT